MPTRSYLTPLMPGIFLGLDDTDARTGMCTTYLLTEVLRALPPGVDLVGYPRLVRLNPTIPWKTRGNGAVAIQLGRGQGAPEVIGMFDGRPLRAYPRGDPLPLDPVLEAAAAVVDRLSELSCESTHPGLVVCARRPTARLYWRAARTVVSKSEALAELRACGAMWREWKEGRGIIGAASAIAWRPHDRTYEVLAYRAPARWGAPRHLEPESVREMEEAFPTTFNSYDQRRGRVAIAPHSACPVLCGIRGDHPEALPEALAMLRCEPVERWVLFETNQGTDDHLQRRTARELVPYSSAILHGTVSGPPAVLPGGHALVPIEADGAVPCAFYEPSKEFRAVARALRPGDEVTVFGSVRAEPWGLNVEKLFVHRLAPTYRPGPLPRCPRCGGRLRSRGRTQGYRCCQCGARSAAERPLSREPRSLEPGAYEPPVFARRHLSKPLKRMGLRMPACPSEISRDPQGLSMVG